MKSPRTSKNIAIASSRATDMRATGFVALLRGAKPTRLGRKFSPLLKTLSYVAVAVVAGLVTLAAINLTPEPRVLRTIVAHRFDASDPQFARSMSSYSLGQMSNANAVQTLVNGDEIFPSMLQAIGAARSTIDFETYIYWSGDVGNEFAQALAAKARQGVEVRVLVDWV